MKFCLIVQGRGLPISKSEGSAPKPHGFHQVRWVEASDRANAERWTLARVRSDDRLRDLVGQQALASIELEIVECREVDDFDDVESNPTGFAFYPE